ncbi:MAG TPA: PQQ-dependent sugar dehydrogenase, partial [Kofleriaceae bacterium]|nr:PQQ-dependent sugar dehydrogenase [Kofleriaceae bacterium]
APAPAAWGAPSTRLRPVPPAIARLVRLRRIATLDHPLALEVPPGDRSGRLFVVERGGRIRILKNGKALPRPFLDLRALVSRDHDEQGLLGLAFHPRYRENRRFYVNYTDRAGDTRVVEYRASAGDPDRADPTSARVLLRLDQPYRNHNGGGLELGPDGRLYVGTGDGGAAGDPLGAGQDRKQRLAKMLRIDVDAARPRPVIVQHGLRNPWRFAFDSKTGDLYIGDVGQDRYEEIDVVAARDLVGANFGWNVMEGNHCFRRRSCDKSRFVAPAVEYDRKAGCSVTGGEVYRGRALPELDGVYFYADYCTAIVRSFRWAAGSVYQHWDWKPVLDPEFKLTTIASFGLDADGELYVVSLDGPIYRLERR